MTTGGAMRGGHANAVLGRAATTWDSTSLMRKLGGALPHPLGNATQSRLSRR